MAKSVCNNSARLTTLVIVGVCLVVAAFTSYIVMPNMVEHIVKQVIYSLKGTLFFFTRKLDYECVKCVRWCVLLSSFK